MDAILVVVVIAGVGQLQYVSVGKMVGAKQEAAIDPLLIQFLPVTPP